MPLLLLLLLLTQFTHDTMTYAQLTLTSRWQLVLHSLLLLLRQGMQCSSSRGICFCPTTAVADSSYTAPAVQLPLLELLHS